MVHRLESSQNGVRTLCVSHPGVVTRQSSHYTMFWDGSPPRRLSKCCSCTLCFASWGCDQANLTLHDVLGWFTAQDALKMVRCLHLYTDRLPWWSMSVRRIHVYAANSAQGHTIRPTDIQIRHIDIQIRHIDIHIVT